METGRIVAADGNAIELTRDMLEDFSVLSGFYGVSIEDFIRNLFDCEFDDAAMQTLEQKVG